MFGHFPIPYEDELFYSVCARFHDNMGYHSHGTSLRELFGKSSVLPIDNLMSLDYFRSQIPPKHPLDVDYIINKNSLLPFYTYFLETANVKQIYNYIQRSPDGYWKDTIPAWSKIGLSGHQYLLYCPLCIDNDRWVCGECYWHRSHQLPGVFFCADHDVLLRPSDVQIRGKHREITLTSAERANLRIDIESTSDLFHISDLLWLAKSAKHLLQRPISGLDITKLYNLYYGRLQDLKLLINNEQINNALLLQRFSKRFPKMFLDILSCDISEKRANWLYIMFWANNYNRVHPLRHLLLIRFCDINISDLLNLSIEPVKKEPL